MNKVIVEKECSCFKKSNLQNNIQMESKDKALIKALRMKDTMNQEFCRKHDFLVREENDDFIISFAPNNGNEFVCCGNGCCD